MCKKKISVIMGVYNCESTLGEAIDSIIQQTYTNWELIVCDDCSKDNTLNVALEYEKAFPQKIKVIRNLENLKLAATLNNCAKYASGDYIARMDGDDISDACRFEKQVDFLINNSDFDLVGTLMRTFDENGPKHIVSIKAEPQKNDLPKFNPFHHATIMMKKSVFDELGGYSVEKKTARVEDVELWFRFFHHGYRGYNIQEALYYVREDDNAKKRRKFQYSLDASAILARGIKLLKLPIYNYVFVLKPILSQMIPYKVKSFIRRKIKSENKRHDT